MRLSFADLPLPFYTRYLKGEISKMLDHSNTSAARSLGANNSHLDYNPEIPPENRRFSPDDGVNATIHRRLSLKQSPLPVASRQDPHKYPLKNRKGEIVYEDDEVTPKPLFNGKNPSYLDEQGQPRLVKGWQQYADRLPTEAELKKWFSHPDTKIGHVAVSVDGKRRTIDIDCKIDEKHFSSRGHFERVTAPLVSMATSLEKTPSEAYHFDVEWVDGDPVKALGKQAANVGIGDVDHAGEMTLFMVCAPTPGYELVKAGPPLEVKSLDDIGLRFTAKASTSQQTEQAPQVTPITKHNPPVGKGVAASTGLGGRLISKRNQAILQGNGSGDRSADLTSVTKDFYGWVNLAAEHGITLEDPTPYIERVAEALGIADKLDRILATIDRASCRPAMESTSSGKKGCLVHLERLMERQEIFKDFGTDYIEVFKGDTLGMIAQNELYSHGYIRIENDFYKWSDTHYERQDPASEEKRINSLAQRIVMRCKTKTGEEFVVRPFVNSRACADAYNWCLRAVPWAHPDLVNPPGINLKNGVLRMEVIEGNPKPQPRLIPHTPNLYYTYAPMIEYRPDADPTYVNQLLEVLDPQFREPMLKIIAASLDVDMVRQNTCRAVRIPICTGSGSNGKDTLFTPLNYIYSGVGMTSKSLRDFQNYDEGKKDCIAACKDARVNVSSENKMGMNIDGIDSLKAVGTGEPLDYRPLYQTAKSFRPKFITIFCTNDSTINLTAAQEAIRSRYVIVPFTKTFKAKPDPNRPNEIKADPRFKDSPDWIKENVCPAYLNLMIDAFQKIFTEEADYSMFDEVMEANKVEANHLYRFALDTGLEEDPDAEVATSVVWERLKAWYVSEEILNISGDREVWQDSVRAGDDWVKGSQQLKRRLHKVFPNIGSKRCKAGGKITGIRFVDPVERALKDCETWEDYQAIGTYHGHEVIRENWSKLTQEVKDRILGMQPKTSTDEPETPLTQAEIDTVLVGVRDAIEKADTHLLQDFCTLTISQKEIVQNQLGLDEQANLSTLIGATIGLLKPPIGGDTEDEF
jgi:phage/plasmid-associated DNA primase